MRFLRCEDTALQETVRGGEPAVSSLISTPIWLNLAPDQSSQVFRAIIARENIMKNPLDSIWGTIISGLVLTVILYVFAINFLK
jgi:hypothetical protein